MPIPTHGRLAVISGLVYLSFALFASRALAQDPTKVEPNHYKLAFENEYVQVVNVHYGPHEKSNLHAHPGGVVVILTGGHLRFTEENGKSQEVFAKAGESRWFPPFKHKVENLGDTAYSAVYIGVKGQHLGVQTGKKDGGGDPFNAGRQEKIARVPPGQASMMDAQTKALISHALSTR